MRLIGQAKQGYFPAPPEAIAGILKHLRRPVEPDPRFKVDDLNILDPCSGEGKALVQLAEGLGVSNEHVFAIELNASRADRIAEAYPDGGGHSARINAGDFTNFGLCHHNMVTPTDAAPVLRETS